MFWIPEEEIPRSSKSFEAARECPARETRQLFLPKERPFLPIYLVEVSWRSWHYFLGEAVSDHGLKYLDVTESHSFVPRIANTSQVQFDLCMKNKPNGFWKEWGIKEGMEEDGRHGCSVKVSEDDTAPRFVFFSFLSSVFRSFEARDLSKVPRIP